MINYRTIAVIKRELKEKLLSKGFIIMTIMLPLLMFGFIGLQTFLMTFDGGERQKIEIITESEELGKKLETELKDYEFIKDSSVVSSFITMDSGALTSYLEIRNDDLISESLSGIMFIPDSALVNKKIYYYSKAPKSIRMLDRFNGPINKVLVETYFSTRDIPPEELQFARMNVDITKFKISEEEGIKEEGFGNLVLAYLFTFLLYISLLMMGSMMMQSVIQEKTNRIVEVLLSSVTSRELLAGKIIGSTITGVLQMLIWLSPVIMLISTTWFALPEELTLDVTGEQILYLLINFLIGLATYLGLFGTIGSIFDSPQDAQSGMWPIMMLIIIPFFISMSMIENPSNPIAGISSMLPFASIIVMPAKMTLVDVPLWQFLVSIVVNLATLILIFPVAGKIYRVGLLWTGKKPKWSEVIKWIKYKY